LDTNVPEGAAAAGELADGLGLAAVVAAAALRADTP
jgi:hypothetical protein